MIKVLFVCLGNICRSPSAEGVMQHLIEKKGLHDKIYVDSAGTIAVHAGEKADYRMRSHAIKRGYDLQSISRQFIAKSDFDKFDYIIAMDNNNQKDLLSIARNETDKKKISKMTDYCIQLNQTEVPDPYYGGEQGFELVLDILEDACTGLLKHIIKENNL